MIRRHIEGAVRRALSDTPVVLLNGARQTGKTTLARMIARESGARYFSLDDAATLALAAGDPAGFIRNQPGGVVLDEIQKAPGLFPAIKLAVDQDRRPGRFLLTGSRSRRAPSRQRQIFQRSKLCANNSESDSVSVSFFTEASR